MENTTIITVILASLAMGIYYFIKDRVILREKIDGVTDTYNKISDAYNIGNTRTKFVTHYASGRKKINYLSESGKTVIVWLNPKDENVQNYTCGKILEVYYLIVIMFWSAFGLVDITQREQFELLKKSKAVKRNAAEPLEKSI